MKAEFIDPEDGRWLSLLKEVRHDFHHVPEYVRLEGDYTGSKPTAFYAEHEDTRFLAPLLISTLPPHLQAPDDWCDATTPYGYPAPLLLPAGDEAHLRLFLRAFRDLASARGVVTAFLRLHPLLALPTEPLRESGELVRHGQTVYFDLSLSEAQVQEQICRNHQRHLKKLIKSGFTVEVDEWSHYPRFIEIYRENMRRLDASPMYFFEGDYFPRLREVLGERMHLGTVKAPNGDIAAAGIFVNSCGIVQYHLGGSADAYLRLSPAKLLIQEMRRWSRAQGAKYLHLGGGLGGNEDSLFHFKAGFSHERADFFTYRMICNSTRYQELMEARQRIAGYAEEPSAFFPAYRRRIE